VRKEGFDIEHMMQTAGMESAVLNEGESATDEFAAEHGSGHE